MWTTCYLGKKINGLHENEKIIELKINLLKSKLRFIIFNLALFDSNCFCLNVSDFFFYRIIHVFEIAFVWSHICILLV